MAVPTLYNWVQKIIANPLHRQVGELIKSKIPDVYGNSVLDIGCGLGNYSLLFTNAKYTGLDADSNYIDHARKIFAKPNVSFLVENAVAPQGLPSFNYIFSVGLYHHLSDKDTITSLGKLRSQLIDGGFMLIFDAVYPKNFNIPGYILRRLDRGKYVRTFGEYSRLLQKNFKTEYINYHTAGVLNFISYKISK